MDLSPDKYEDFHRLPDNILVMIAPQPALAAEEIILDECDFFWGCKIISHVIKIASLEIVLFNQVVGYPFLFLQ